MSRLAKNLIKENKRTKAPFLDLGNCDLTEVPPEIGELVWLKSLSFSSDWLDWTDKNWTRRRTRNSGKPNQLMAVGRLEDLTSLRELFIDGTWVSDLAPLTNLRSLQLLAVADTQVNDLRPLAKLSSLQVLGLSNTGVSDLAPLANLDSLQWLNASGTQISNLAPLANLASLQRLHVSDTQVCDLAPLANLLSLQWLHAANTQVRDLAPLANLPSFQSLNVGSTQVSNLAPLANLTSLLWLHVGNTQVCDLTPLANLTSLQRLKAWNIQIDDLTALCNLFSLQALSISSTQVSDLRPLANLSSLRSLHVPDTRVDELAPLANLPSLRSLDVAGTPVRDLRPLANLSSLRSLNILRTQVSDLAPLADLISLQWLHASQTQVSSLVPLAKLTSLNWLNLSNSQVSDLSPLVEHIRKGLRIGLEGRGDTGIIVKDCPLTNPPREIVAQGNKAILNYFDELARGQIDHLYEAKMLVLGEGGAGKTSLIRRLYQPKLPLPSEKETTRGIEIHKHEFHLKNGRTFRLNVWDFGGQQIYHATHQFFLTQRSLYVLVDDTRKDYKSVSDEGFRYWLELIEIFGGHSPTIIFQNEKSSRSKVIDFRGISQRYDNVKQLYAGNLDDPHAADRLRDAIEFFAAQLDHIGEELPASWIKVRAEIEQLAARHPYVPVEEYFRVCEKYLEDDETRALHLSRYLHDLGVFLHFQDDPLLKRTVILQNEWATAAVFRILDDEIVKKKLGRFSDEDGARLWKGSGYERMHSELLALMRNFELCYELRDASPPTRLAPQLLPPAKPEELASWARPGDLIVRYKYDFLPKGIISRLTVRQHRFVRDPGMAWVTGVLFEQDNTAVLVEVLPTGDEVEMRSRGPENKALLSVISADLDALNDSFKGLHDKIETRVPCNCKSCRTTMSPWFFGHRDLVRRKEYGKLQVECSLSFENVDVLQLLDGIKVSAPPAWATGASKEEPLRVLRIFLASSSEIRDDRDAFDLYMRQQTDELRKQGIYLELVRWEHFLDAMSETRLQDEYNEQVRKCDLFVCLFFKKVGEFTREEFKVAHEHFKSTGKPLIYTYFKNAPVNTADWRPEDFQSLHDFKNHLKEFGHFPTDYKSAEELKLHFRDQLPKIRERLGV